MGRIVILAALALFGVLGGDLTGSTGCPLVAHPAASVSVSVAPDEPAPDPGATASLDEPPGDDSVDVALARSPGEPCPVLAPSFVRAPAFARAQAAPPDGVHETPPRPPQS